MNDSHVDHPLLSVVVPVYNEEENLEPLVDELLRELDALEIAYEILLVDDGSSDDSPAIIDALARDHGPVRSLHFLRNCGQTAAFDAGFKAARGELVATIDADLQNDAADIGRLLEALDGHDAAVGYRKTRRDSWTRRQSSIIANAIRNRLSGDDIIDTGCSLKLFRREALREIKLFNGMHRFLPTLLRMEGRSVVQIPVNHRERHAGTSKYGIRNRAVRAFIDLLAVRWMKNRSLGYEVRKDDS